MKILSPAGPAEPVGPFDVRSILVLTLGPNLVGKGEMGKMLIKHLCSLNSVEDDGTRRFSLGDHLRDRCDTDADFNQKYGEAIRTGALLPNEVVDEIAIDCIGGMDFGIGDGYPRNSHQARLVAEVVQRRQGQVVAVEFMASLACSLARAEKRGRPDDAPPIVVSRYQKYMRNRAGVLGTLGFYGIPIHHYCVNEDPAASIHANFSELLESVQIPTSICEISRAPGYSHGSEVPEPPRRGHWMRNIPGMLAAVA